MSRPIRIGLLTLVALFTTLAWAKPSVAAAEPAPAAAPAGAAPAPRDDGPTAAAKPLTSRLLIISVDGLRPDMLLRANTPTMHALFRGGTFSFWARTVPHAITLPSHTSMLTGVIPRKHEIEWNKDLPLKEPVYPRFPTLFEVAHKHGFTTAMAAGKSKFETLNKPGTLDWPWVTDSTKAEDADVAAHAVEIIREHRPQVMFVHLPSTDNVGHAIGWGTPQQEKTVEAGDAAIAQILAAVDEAKLRDETIVILTADHGGAGLTHLPDDARARHIPWIVNGRGVRKNVDLTTYPNLIINTEDTFATASFLLGLPLSKDLDGKPIREILEDQGELIHTEPTKDR